MTTEEFREAYPSVEAAEFRLRLPPGWEAPFSIGAGVTLNERWYMVRSIDYEKHEISFSPWNREVEDG